MLKFTPLICVFALLGAAWTQEPVSENMDSVEVMGLARSLPLDIEGDELVEENGCVDIPPSDGFTCADQVAWGKCLATWMVEADLCARSCGRCEVPKTMKELISDMLDASTVAVNLNQKQRSGALDDASEAVQSFTLQNDLDGFEKIAPVELLHDIDFTLLVSAAGVLYRNKLEEQCPGANGVVLTTLGSDISKWLLSVQLDEVSNKNVQFVMGVRVDCSVSDEETESRFDIITVRASFPNFVDSVESLYTFVGGIDLEQSNQV